MRRACELSGKYEANCSDGGLGELLDRKADG